MTHQAAIVYLLEENKILKARLCGRKLRLTDDERRRLAVKGKALGRKLWCFRNPVLVAAA